MACVGFSYTFQGERLACSSIVLISGRKLILAQIMQAIHRRRFISLSARKNGCMDRAAEMMDARIQAPALGVPASFCSPAMPVCVAHALCVPVSEENWPVWGYKFSAPAMDKRSSAFAWEAHATRWPGCWCLPSKDVLLVGGGARSASLSEVLNVLLKTGRPNALK